MGSWWVGSGIPGVAAGSCASYVASGLGVEADDPPVAGAFGVEAGGEVGSDRAGSGPDFRRRSDGPASYPCLPC